MTTFLWLFWPLAPNASCQDRLRLAAYTALILAPLALAFLGWMWCGPSLEQVLGR